MAATPRILILGAGITGMAAAICLQKINTKAEDAQGQAVWGYEVYEAREEPSTIGGAVNLTPTALRYLSYLGVLPRLEERGYPVKSIEIFSLYSGKWLSEIRFDQLSDSEFKAMRVLRKDLLQALLNTFKAGEKQRGVHFGHKVRGVAERSAQGTGDVEYVVAFENGTTVSGCMVLGCDGIHSSTRTSFVEPDRVPVYSGLAAAYGLLEAKDIKAPLHFQDTSVSMSRSGSLMTSFCDAARRQIYFAAIMEMKEERSREGWILWGGDQDRVRKDMQSRFDGGGIECLDEMIEKVQSFCLYPVFNLPPGGKWSRGRVLLLGDAAHAMPPQGESTGLSIEDAVLFTEILQRRHDLSMDDVISRYKVIRKPRINEAFTEAQYRWETAKDGGWLRFKFQELLVPWFIWWTRKSREESFMLDVRRLEL